MNIQKQLGLMAILVLLSLILVGCGGGKSSSSTSSPTKASGEISEEQATTFVANDAQVIAAQLLDSVDGSVTSDITSSVGSIPTDQTKARTVKALLRKLEEGKCQNDDNGNDDNKDGDDNSDNSNDEESSDCTYKVTEGSETDADCDGIPAHVVAEFDCTFKEDTYSFTTSGKFTITDKDDANTSGGYEFIIEDYKYDYTYTYSANGSSQSQTYHYTGEYEGTFDNSINNGTYHTEYDFAFSGTYALDTVSSYEYTLGYFMNLDYTPLADSNDNPYDAGTISSLKGFYKYEFSSKGQEAQGKAQYVVAIDAKDLVHPSTPCASYYQSGTLSFTDGSDNEIVITYNNCTYSSTYNGQPL